jgi:catechol 2,3-dioxygenase-like lactoylglutathione lyase family enzyme
MLRDKTAVATLAVKDLAAARKFYEGKLGLEVTDEQGEEALTFASGSSTVLVYRSQYAGTNKATAVNWLVGKDLDKIVAGLKERGVTFERYEMPDMTHRGDIHVADGLEVAWFKDPDGNIIALMNE